MRGLNRQQLAELVTRALEVVGDSWEKLAVAVASSEDITTAENSGNE